jgi:hypothetical protein
MSVPDGQQTVEYQPILRQGVINELGKDEKHRQLMTQNFLVTRQLI